ncbi:MAG: hypothetical protein ABIH03_09545 [Pseudomonadota bacterium]
MSDTKKVYGRVMGVEGIEVDALARLVMLTKHPEWSAFEDFLVALRQVSLERAVIQRGSCDNLVKEGVIRDEQAGAASVLLRMAKQFRKDCAKAMRDAEVKLAELRNDA